MIKDVYYINLPYSEGRRAHMEIQADKFNAEFTRIVAVEGKRLGERPYRHFISIRTGIPMEKLEPDYYKNRTNFKTMSNNIDNILPKVGLYLSTIIALKTALKNGSDGALILEDDCIVNTLEIPTIDDEACDIVHTGGFIKGEYYSPDEKIIAINTDSVKVYGTAGYCIPNRQKIRDILKVLMSPYIDGIKGYDKHVDWRSGTVKLRIQAIDLFFINYFQKNNRCYALNPFTTEHPKENISTIDTKQCNYKKLGLRFNWGE